MEGSCAGMALRGPHERGALREKVCGGGSPFESFMFPRSVRPAPGASVFLPADGPGQR